jgi:HSP20 family protein
MTLIRWQPIREMEPVNHWMKRFIDDVNAGFPSLELGNFNPNIDVSEDKDSVFVCAELPGLEKSDVKITVSDENVLMIRGEKKREVNTEQKNFYRIERSFGAFVRSFTLPAEVDGEKITAQFDKGILSITLPKLAPSKPKEREINIG